ncbi:MAG: sulfotransferase [Microcoleaceae cyanobacterium]
MQLSALGTQEIILQVVQEMLTKSGIESDDSIQLETQLVQDLNFASIDFIELIVLIEDRFKQKLGFHDLLMTEGQYIEDLSINELIQFVDQKLNSEVPVKSEAPVQPVPKVVNFAYFNEVNSETIGKAEVEEFRQTIDRKVTEFLPHLATNSRPKNRPAIFILCPPRSGSTLLRVILAGHPQIFAPPELHLLSYATLSQRQAALSNEWNHHLLQGTWRALMQAHHWSAEEAKSWMETYENQNLTTQQFYQLLQQAIGDKILVDKTPTYASHLGFLQRAEREFEQAYYIHLVRHPYGMIRSYQDAKLDRIVPFMNANSFSRQELAELTWIVSNQNILEFFHQVPQHRQLQVKFEDLVHSPEKTVQSLCNFLNLDFCLEMLQPYQDKAQRMTDGVDVSSVMSGDLKFHLHRSIEPDAADRWQKYHSEDFLSEMSCHLAQRLGYSLNPQTVEKVSA